MVKKVWFRLRWFFAKRHIRVFERPCDFFVDWMEYKEIDGVLYITGEGFRCYPPVNRLRGAEIKVEYC